MLITSSELWPLFKKTIDNISTESMKKDMCCYDVAVKVSKMRDGYSEDIETAGMGLFTEKTEGGAMDTDKPTIGGTVRYLPKSFAKKTAITHEAMRDNKYENAIKISKRLMASAYKTQDIDAAGLFLTATTTTGGFDGVALASPSHTLPSGQTVSNYLGSSAGGSAVGMTPSVAAIQQMRLMATKMPGPNGIVDSLELKALVFPESMRDLMDVITGTKKDVGTNFNDLNTVASYGLKKYPIKHFDAVNENLWGGLTSAEDGLKIFEREKITSHTWTANDEMVAFHGVYYAGTQGWSNWRAYIHGRS